ncbi:hypothetical protein EV122DRAFT_227400, partial [Schizophyllum commune]
CSQRTFFAVLILAIQSTLDRCYSNSAWARISSLQLLEIGRCAGAECASQRHQGAVFPLSGHVLFGGTTARTPSKEPVSLKQLTMAKA